MSTLSINTKRIPCRAPPRPGFVALSGGGGGRFQRMTTARLGVHATLAPSTLLPNPGYRDVTTRQPRARFSRLRDPACPDRFRRSRVALLFFASSQERQPCSVHPCSWFSLLLSPRRTPPRLPTRPPARSSPSKRPALDALSAKPLHGSTHAELAEFMDLRKSKLAGELPAPADDIVPLCTEDHRPAVRPERLAA